MRKDISSWEKVHSEDRGVNEKEWVRDPETKRTALFKETQIKKDSGESTYADFAESIVSDICRLLDVPSPDVELVVRNGNIGCISYNFCDTDNGEEQTEIGTVIQNKRINFNSKSMIDNDTKEAYGIGMILEGLESISESKGNFTQLRRSLLKDILVDSLIDHYDRNPSNLSVLRVGKKVRLSPKYDNGTSLSISVPLDALKKMIIDYPDEKQRHTCFRGNILSKIGYLGRKYVKYPDLETYIFHYYYDDVKDFVETIRNRLTDENINQILSQEKYNELDDVHKIMISGKLKTNRDSLLQRFNIISKKNVIDKILYNRSARSNFLSHVQKGTIQTILPEYINCIGKKDKDKDYESSLDIQISEKIQSIVDIDGLARFFDIYLEPISKREKSLLKWTIIIENLEKATGNNQTLSNITTRLGFLKEDTDTISALIKDKFKDENDIIEAREIIYGKDGIGEENVNLYIAKKFVDALAMRKDIREQRIDELRAFQTTIRECIDLENIVQNHIPINAKTFHKSGITDKNIITTIQYKLARAYQNNPKLSRGDLMNLAMKYSRELSSEKIEISRGVFVNEDIIRDINDHTIILDNGSKLVLFNEPFKHQNIVLKMGADYFGQICKHHSGDGVTLSLVAKKGKKFPNSISDYARKVISKYNTSKTEKGAFVYREPQGKKGTSCFIVSSLNKSDSKIPNITVQEMTQKIIDLFNEKEQVKEEVTHLDN